MHDVLGEGRTVDGVQHPFPSGESSGLFGASSRNWSSTVIGRLLVCAVAGGEVATRSAKLIDRRRIWAHPSRLGCRCPILSINSIMHARKHIAPLFGILPVVQQKAPSCSFWIRVR